MENKVKIEIVYALPDHQYVLPLFVELNTTIEQAIKLSGILDICPEINFEYNKVGIFYQLVELTQIIKAGDRIEIYRPLQADPQEIRRRRMERATRKR